MSDESVYLMTDILYLSVQCTIHKSRSATANSHFGLHYIPFLNLFCCRCLAFIHYRTIPQFELPTQLWNGWRFHQGRMLWAGLRAIQRGTGPIAEPQIVFVLAAWGPRPLALVGPRRALACTGPIEESLLIMHYSGHSHWACHVWDLWDQHDTLYS